MYAYIYIYAYIHIIYIIYIYREREMDAEHSFLVRGGSVPPDGTGRMRRRQNLRASTIGATVVLPTVESRPHLP